MTPRKTIIYFLSGADNLTYSLEDGVIVKNTFPKPILDNPIGWNTVELAFGTNNKYWSLNRAFTVPLTFVNDGAEILRSLIYNGKGYEEEVTLTILSLNPETGVYELLFRGKIDFTKMKDDPTTGVTVNTIEGGLFSYLNANDGVTYEIPCNPTNKDCIKVQFDGVELFDRYKFSFYDFYVEHTISMLSVMPFTYLSKEGDSVGIIYGSPTYEEIGIPILEPSPFTTAEINNYAATSANYFFSSATKTKVTIEGQIKISKQISEDAPVEIYLKSSLGNGKIIYSETLTGSDIVTVNIKEDIEIEAEEKYFLFLYSLTSISLWESVFYVATTTINPPSISYAIQPLQLGQQLVSKMTDGKYTMKSNFFTNHNNIVAAGGEAIRELKDENGNLNGVLKTTFQDYFNSYNAIYNLGIKVVDNVLWIEPKEDLYNDNSEVLDLGDVSDISISYAEEYLVNSVKVGYPVQDYSERNGRYEFNDTIEEKLPVTAVNKEYNIVSKYRGDSYGIEFNRGKLNNKDTTDNKGDNEVFLINVDSTAASNGVMLSVTKGVQENVVGNVSFDDILINSGGVIDSYIAINESKTSFTYTNATSEKTRLTAYLYGTKGNEAVTFNLTVNGAVVASQMINDFQTTFRVMLDANPILNTNDKIEVSITGLVNLTGGGLDIQVLEAAPVQIYGLKRVVYDSITGVPTSTVYNIEEMTPKRMLLKHGNYLRSLLFQLPGEKITFQTADKNKDLSTTLGLITITEKEDVIVGTLDGPLFLPFEISFTTKVPYSLAKIMNRLTAGYIKINYNNYPIHLLPIGDMKCKPVTEEAQEWKLLASPLNSLDTLLKLSEGAIIISDYMRNQLIISDLNPVHFVRYDCQKTDDREIITPAKPPTGNQGFVGKVGSAEWTFAGAYIYDAGFPSNGLGNVLTNLTTPLWINGIPGERGTGNVVDGRMNANGIWQSNNTTPNTIFYPLNEWIGFSRKITLPQSKILYVGIAGDNLIRFKLNGETIIDTTNGGVGFGAWNIYPVQFRQGDNIAEMSVMNTDSGTDNNPAGFACEIYDMTAAELQAATSEADLNIVFRTADMVGDVFDIGTTIGYSCDEGVLIKNDDGSYSCKVTIPGNPCVGGNNIPSKYHFKGIYDDRFSARIDRYSDKGIYYQKWQTNDTINLQFITAGYGALELQIFDCKANLITIASPDITADTSVQQPYVKQQFTIDVSTLPTGMYQFVVSIGGVYIAISEWQNVVNDLPDTLLIEYYNTKNKPDAYFKDWRPSIRVEGFLPPPTPESTSTTYEDEPGDTEILNGSGWMKQRVLLGDGYGLPDYMAKKLNRILLLNKVSIEGVEYTKAGDARLEPSSEITGYPMMYYTVEMRESNNVTALVVSDMELGNSFTSTLTLDAEAFGGAPGVIQIEID